MTDMLIPAQPGSATATGGMAQTGLRIRILGPLEATADGKPLDLGSRKQRAVLAVLAIEANRVVSADRLAEELWPHRRPAAATGSLQAYVSNLRRILEPGRPSGEPSSSILTRSPGYVLRIDLADLDAARFEAAAGEGRRALRAGSPATAKRRLEEALGEWRGDALADFCSEPFAQAAAARLEELRLAAVEDLLEAEIALGAHAAAVAELEALVAVHPLRERLWELLLVALYRSGRQADALRAYQAARRTLAEELGIEPRPSLRRLEADILAQAPLLEWGDSAPVPGAAPAVDPAPSPTELAAVVAQLAAVVAELRAVATSPRRAPPVGPAAARVRGLRISGRAPGPTSPR